jgi:hypothetical protein
MGDIRPKGKVLKSKGGTQLTGVDNNTRTILSMDIGPKTLKGSGSGKITKNVKSAIAQVNAKKP